MTDASFQDLTAARQFASASSSVAFTMFAYQPSFARGRGGRRGERAPGAVASCTVAPHRVILSSRPLLHCRRNGECIIVTDVHVAFGCRYARVVQRCRSGT